MRQNPRATPAGRSGLGRALRLSPTESSRPSTRPPRTSPIRNGKGGSRVLRPRDRPDHTLARQCGPNARQTLDLAPRRRDPDQAIPVVLQHFCGGPGIRTLGNGHPSQRFSRPPHSATMRALHPSPVPGSGSRVSHDTQRLDCAAAYTTDLNTTPYVPQVGTNGTDLESSVRPPLRCKQPRRAPGGRHDEEANRRRIRRISDQS